jgi:hypothetical protein
MKVFIKKVENGAEYEDKVYDFWVSVQLSSGKEIKVFDFVPFDLRNNILQHSECLLVAGFLESSGNSQKDSTIIKGFLIDYNIKSKDWRNVREDIINESWFGLQTEDGIYLINPEEIRSEKVKLGEILEYIVGRFDLVAIK